ncbi:MAG: Rieske (2Fe-2S) protein [Thermoprotei archaeon]
MCGYVPVARKSELKSGVIKPFRYKGGRYILVEYGGKVYCFDGLCPHELGPLEFGQLYDKHLYCSYHQAVFDVTSGKPLPGSPTENGLKSYPTSIEGDTVYVMF